MVVAHPDGARLAQLLDAAASGHLPARVHAVVPLDQVATAHRAVAKGGVRGRYVLQPLRVGRTLARGLTAQSPLGSGYRLGSDRGSPNHGSTLFSKRVIAQIRSPVRVRT